MEKRFLSPQETIITTISNGVKKTQLSFKQTIFLGFLAGVYIGFGAYGSITIMQTLKNIDIGLAKFMGAVVFPVGLMLVIICGAELFTGNNLLVMALLENEISFSSMLRNWVLVYFSNFLGSALLAYCLSKSGLIKDSVLNLTLSIAQNKISPPIIELIIRGILCNILVVLAVLMATASLDIISKIFSCWFPIMLFVLCGYEHSVANMFFLPLAKFVGGNISWAQIFFKNLFPVTLGNLIGGAIIIPFTYVHSYMQLQKKKDLQMGIKG